MRQKLIVALAIASAFSFSDGIAQTAARRRAVGRTPVGTIAVHDDFRNGQLGWEAGFADYSPANEGMELEAGIRPLPAELEIAGTGFMMHGVNRSDDLFSFLTKKLTAADGVRPNQRYIVSFRVVMASNAGDIECIGAGGAPGLSVALKVGASSDAPRVELDGLNHYRVVNIDHDSDVAGGRNMTVAGNVSNGSDDCRGEAPFRTFARSHQHPFAIAANAAGEIWLLAGTDSGFEGRQTLYYQSIDATLTPVP